MLWTHPAASDAYSPLYCDADGSRDTLSERKGCIHYLDTGREIASPGLRATAVERVDVRSEHAGIYKEIIPLLAVRMGYGHDYQAEAHPRLHGGSLNCHCKLRGCHSLQLCNSVSHGTSVRLSSRNPARFMDLVVKRLANVADKVRCGGEEVVNPCDGQW